MTEAKSIASGQKSRYSVVAMALHWMIAFALAFQIGLGGKLEELTLATGLFDATQFHKSIGISILLLSLIRLGWRSYKPPPPALPDKSWTYRLSKLVHAGLYIFMIGTPITGWLMVSTSKLDIDTLLFGTFFWPDVPFVHAMESSTRAILNDFAAQAHDVLAMMGMGLFLLHVIGAIRHQLLLGDPLLARIWPGKIGYKKLGGSLLTIGLFGTLLATTIVARTSIGEEVQGEDPAVEVADTGSEVEETKQVNDTKATIESADQGKEPDDRETSSDNAPESDPDDTVADREVAEVEPVTIAYSWNITAKQPVAFSFDWNGETISGVFSDWDATILFGEQALTESAIDVIINLASARTGDTQIDEALPGPDFFGVAAQSQARFRSSDIRKIGDDSYEAHGTLSLKGTGQPMIVSFTLDISGNQAEAKGRANVDRTGFDVGIGNFGDLSNDVTISFQFTATR